MPTFFYSTIAREHDSNAMDAILYEENSFYIFDKCFSDFSRLHYIDRLEILGQVRECHQNPDLFNYNSLSLDGNRAEGQSKDSANRKYNQPKRPFLLNQTTILSMLILPVNQLYFNY